MVVLAHSLSRTREGLYVRFALLSEIGHSSLSGAISTVSGLNKFGPGQLVFANSLTYSGVTTVDSGTLVNNSNLNGSLFLSTSAILQGQGSSTSLTSIGGNIVPGTSGAGIISPSGALSLDSNSGFVSLLNGTTPGSQYGEIEANGPIQLGNANLIVTLGYTPSANETFTLINNTGNAAISGTFLGLNEGSLLNAGGQSFKISYVGGDGNNVVLTHQETTATTLTSSPTTSVYGQPVNLTANVSVTGSGTGTPTGSVTFYNGTTPLGTAPLDANATAKFATSNLSIGASTLIAVYTGSDNFLTSMSSNLTQTVSQCGGSEPGSRDTVRQCDFSQWQYLDRNEHAEQLWHGLLKPDQPAGWQ